MSVNKPLKLAIGGKGGVGKTTLTALLANIYSAERQVYVVDADPSLNLAQAIGIPKDLAGRITPLSQMSELIQERLGSSGGGFFKLNPKVDDLVDKVSLTHGNLKLVVMGTVVKGGAGCVCAENTLLRAFLAHLLLEENQMVLVDLEAGVEHLGRRTVQAVDALLIVAEPGQRSIQVARQMQKLAADIGLQRVLFIGNKIATEDDLRFIRQEFDSAEILGLIPYTPRFQAADRQGVAVFSDVTPEVRAALEEIKTALTFLT